LLTKPVSSTPELPKIEIDYGRHVSPIEAKKLVAIAAHGPDFYEDVKLF
jgi:hypothetical protein